MWRSGRSSPIPGRRTATCIRPARLPPHPRGSRAALEPPGNARSERGRRRRLTAGGASFRPMGTVYAIANHKGGVGKTTTAVNLAACVAEAGYDTLLIDIDPQCNATIGLGIGKDAPRTIYDVLVGTAALADVVMETSIDHLSLVPSGPDLAGATVELPRMAGSETRLREALRADQQRYAFTLLDCPPALGPLTVNALVAADRVIVPVQS